MNKIIFKLGVIFSTFLKDWWNVILLVVNNAKFVIEGERLLWTDVETYLKSLRFIRPKLFWFCWRHLKGMIHKHERYAEIQRKGTVGRCHKTFKQPDIAKICTYVVDSSKVKKNLISHKRFDVINGRTS